MKFLVRNGAGLQFLAASALLLLAAACGDATPLQDFRDSNAALRAVLTGSSSPPPSQTVVREDGEVLVCPPVQSRENTVFYDSYTRDAPPVAKNLRYQAKITKYARECDFQPDYFAIKVGFAGRVLVGSAGGPGEVVLPIRVELAARGDRIVWSKTYKLPVSIPQGSDSQFFAHVIDDLVYQPRYGEKLEDFRVYTGFDKPDQPPVAPPTSGLGGATGLSGARGRF